MARKLAKKAATKKPEMVVTSETLGDPIEESFLPTGSRRKKAPAAKKATKKRGKRKKATRVYSVTPHQRPPQYVRTLVVIDTDDPIWVGVDEEDTPIVHAYPEAKDGIVWIIPPHDASELAIERVNRAVKNDGAHTIKLMPRASSAAVVPAQQHEDAGEHPPQTAREMVMEMAAEANSANTKALKKLLNEVLGEEGL